MLDTSVTVVSIGALAIMVLGAAPVNADKCTGAKLGAMGKYESSLAACNAKVALRNDPSTGTRCRDKAKVKFELAFAKAGTCLGIQSSCETRADNCEAAIVGAVPDNATGNDRCESAKRKAAGKLADGELRCYAKAASTERPMDTSCIAKVAAKFAAAVGKAGTCPDDGSLQSTTENSCVLVLTDGDGQVVNICGTGTTTTTLCPPNHCGDGIIQAACEQCDGQGACTADCYLNAPVCCEIDVGANELACIDNQQPTASTLYYSCTEPGGTARPGTCLATGPCPGGYNCDLGTCQVHSFPPTSICCQATGSCSAEIVQDEAESYYAWSACVYSLGTPIAGTCGAGGTCMPDGG